MIRVLVIGAAIVAALAVPVFAGDEDVREYRSHTVETDVGHQGREYMAHGVLVVEGAPRWSEYRFTSVNRRHENVDLAPLFQIFE